MHKNPLEETSNEIKSEASEGNARLNAKNKGLGMFKNPLEKASNAIELEKSESNARLKEARNKLEKLESKLKELSADIKNARDREKSFIEVLTKQLMTIYDNSKVLVPDSKEPGWLEGMFQGLMEVVKVAAITGGVFAIANHLLRDKNIAVEMAIPIALFMLWDVRNIEDARNCARGFLTIVEDVKGERELIHKRFRAIAGTLAKRFKYAIQELPSNENGNEKLANFFSTAIARDVPSATVRASLTAGKLSAEMIVERVSEAAIPQDSKDCLYSKWFQKHKLATISEKDARDSWTINGLLLKSPLCVLIPKEKYYVRDGKLGRDEENRADKYPAQIVMKELPRYLEADSKSLEAIKERLPLEKKFSQAKQDHESTLQKVRYLEQKNGVALHLRVPGGELSVTLKRTIAKARLLEEQTRKKEGLWRAANPQQEESNQAISSNPAHFKS